MGDNISPSLVSQAQTILAAATSLQKQLDDAALPQPSFAASGRRNWFDANHLPELLEIRLKLLDSAQTMIDLVMGPSDTIEYFARPVLTKFEVFRTLNILKAAEYVPVDGDISVVALARKLEVDLAIFERYLKTAYLIGIFRESRKGYVAHTGLSAEMPTSPYYQHRLSDMYVRSCSYVPEAMKLGVDPLAADSSIPVKLADRQKGGRNFWKQLADNNQDGKGMKAFATQMQRLGLTMYGGSYDIFTWAFEWDKIEKGILIDVGGGNGHIAVNIAEHLTNMEFVVQDLQQNAEPARKNIEQHNLESRVRFQTHDFFQPQPEDLKPSAYLLSRIIHDWQDDDCVNIVKNLVPAMEKLGTRLLITDRVMPDSAGDISPYKEFICRSSDLAMYTFYGSKERTLEDIKTILSAADSRLKVIRCNQPMNSAFAFMEVELTQ